MWNRLVQRLAARDIQEARGEAYLRGLYTGRAERPMTCGLSQQEHCGHSYMYDPGQ